MDTEDADRSLANMEKRRYELMLLQLQKKLEEAEWKAELSENFTLLLLKAYTALRSYGVDYQKLRSYEKWEGIQWFKGASNITARESMTRWIVEIGHDIDAAIRRKTNIHEVDLNA